MSGPAEALSLLDSAPAAGLRATAAAIRERAQAATDGPWERSPGSEAVIAPEHACEDGHTAAHLTRWYGGWPVCESISDTDREHVLAWQPRTAVLVAALLDRVAGELERCYADRCVRAGDLTEVDIAVLAVARAWLASAADAGGGDRMTTTRPDISWD
jgi:hypothetical protein